jgi:hypothetical protein
MGSLVRNGFGVLSLLPPGEQVVLPLRGNNDNSHTGV